MSMGSISVRPEQVIALAGQIRNGSAGIRSRLDELESKVGALRASWDGEAQVAYDTAQAQWTQSLNRLNELLQQIAGKTEEIAQGYVSTDKSAAGRFA
jgi:6 kDa early secretory antigenic target